MNENRQAACGGCAGIEAATPLAVDNRPGLAAVAYRVGDHARFRQTLLTRLAAHRELADLTSRDADDFSIALLDAAAVLGDVLTFYQERIANEHYLPTAGERLSALELGRLVGYRLRPGVAADVWLAFTLEAARMPGEAPETTLEAGIRTQSIPGPGETAQVFETVEAVRARPEWNAMRPRLTRYQTFTHASPSLRLAGLATGLKPGDGLILTSDDQESRLSIVTKVELRADAQATLVGLRPVEPPSAPSPGPSPTRGPGGLTGGRFEEIGTLGGLAVRHAAALTREAAVATDSVNTFLTASATTVSVGTGFGGVLNTTVSGVDLFASALINNYRVSDLFANLAASAPAPKGVLALRARAAIFGHNAPPFLALPEDQRNNAYEGRVTTWVDSEGITLDNYPGQPEESTEVFLDNVYPPIAAGGFVAIKEGNKALVYKLEAVAEVSRADFGLSAKVTRLTLDGGAGMEHFRIRATTVFAHSEELKLARLPIDDPVAGLELELEGWIEGIYPGQRLIVCGERADLVGVKHCELAEIDGVAYVAEQEGFTRLTLKAALLNPYRRDSVAIHGNVIRATHGEAVSEVLGGGDPRLAWQGFELRQPPLTHVSSAAPEDAGARSSLELRADGVAWREAPSFFGQPPEARVFVTHLADDGKTTVRFGDGKTGARPPGGATNLRARYRKGIGRGGNVRAGQISLLLTRPLGLKEVANPIAAAGGADAESLDDVRRNAPLSVRTLGRVVSLTDYADFARAFAGVAKAHAAWVWDGGRRVVALSVAGTDGAAVAAGSPLHGNLLGALAQAGDPGIPVALLSYTPGLVRLTARLNIDPAHEAATVLAAADAAVRAALAFGSRDFGEPLAASRVTALLQAVPGVLAVDLDSLYRALEPPALQPMLFAASPQSGTTGLAAAELLTLDPGGLQIEVMT
jgi:hypothetical protein